MDEQTVEKITESMKRMAEVAEALQQTLMHISAQQEEISAKVEKIVAAIEENYEVRSSKDEVRAPLPMNVLGRKTLSPLVTMILGKQCGRRQRHGNAGQGLEYAVAGTAHRGEVGDGAGGNYPVVRSR